MNLPIAKEKEVYAAKEMIDFGNGRQEVIVIYPKNKLIPKALVNKALRELTKHEEAPTV